MSLKDSARKVFGLSCSACGNTDTEYRCARCGKKFCKPCVNSANWSVERDLKNARNSGLLAGGNPTAINLLLNLISKISDNMSPAYCPRCSSKAMNRMAAGKRLSNVGDLYPSCEHFRES